MRCIKCGKVSEYCMCVDMCHRCNQPVRGCLCEERLRPGLRDYAEDHLQEDDEFTENLERDYGDDEEKTPEYWHGYNYVKRAGVKKMIKCPYRDHEQAKDFYRGVSDCRFSS